MDVAEKQNKQQSELHSKLWSMANDLRGTMDASEFKNYILGLIFYRFLSERLVRYIEEKLLNKKLSEYVNDLIENRSIFLSNDMKGIEVIDNEKIKQNYYFIPFIIDSDVVGSIIMFSSKEFDENSKSLLLIASKLLVNYIE